MIAKGKYPGRCVSKALKETAKFTPYVELGFEFTGGPHTGEFLAWRGWLSPKAYDRTAKALRACGWRGNRVDDLSGIDDKNVVTLVVDHEEYPENSGKFRAVIAFVNGSGGDAVSPERAKEIADEIAARHAGDDAGDPGSLPF